MAFARKEQARLFLIHQRWSEITTLQTSLHVADWPVAPSRFAPSLSTTHGDLTTEDLGISPDWTHTSKLPSACRTVTSQQPPYCHGARTPGRTPQLLARLRHNNLLIVMAPELLDALPEQRRNPVPVRRDWGGRDPGQLGRATPGRRRIAD